MAHKSDPVSKAVYRSVLQYARRFDKNIAAKVFVRRIPVVPCYRARSAAVHKNPSQILYLAGRPVSAWRCQRPAIINQHGIVRPPSDDLEAVRGDRRLYAAGLDVVVGTQYLASPERMIWSMQRLIKNLRRADETNMDAIIERVVQIEDRGGADSSLGPSNGPRLDQIREEDGAAAQSIEVFFPGALRGVQVADKLNAGFAALRELSAKWALAGSLGLTGERKSSTKRKWRRIKLPKTRMTRRAKRALRNHERRASRLSGQLGAGSARLSGGCVEPTDVPTKGVFLISHPAAGLHAPGDIFHRSVVLVVHHYPGGSYGLVVNKERGETLEQAVSPDSVPLASEALQRVLHNPVRSGGPVMSRLAWLHHHEEVGGVPLSEDSHDPVFFCGMMDKASELVGEGAAEPTDFSLLVGASMWASGQLQGELDRGMWIMAKAPASLALEGGENMWREMLDAMGGPYAELGRVPHGNRWGEIGAKNLPSDWP